MNNDIKDLKERMERIERKLDHLPYPLRNLLDCHIDFGLKIRPLFPTTTTQAIYIDQMELRLKASIQEDIEKIEKKINNYLRYNI